MATISGVAFFELPMKERKVNEVNSYGSIFQFGHRSVQNILNGEVVAQEKIDGSQVSFCRFPDHVGIRSKGQQIYPGDGNKMFAKAVETIESLELPLGYVFRGEYLQKPKHNTLAYGRTPEKFIILYDIERSPGTEDYLQGTELCEVAEQVGLELVPTFFSGEGLTFEMMQGFLERESILGGCLVEGVVVKNYNQFTEEKKVARVKIVSQEFKEKHQKDWKKANPGRQDIVIGLIESLRSEGRWTKAVQHLRDAGNDVEVQLIGALIKEIQNDIVKEEADYIQETLVNHFKPQILRGAIAGFPEWFKQKLAEGEFDIEEGV